MRRRLRERGRTVLATACALLVVLAASALGATGDTILVSREDGPAGNVAPGAIPKVSGNGNVVAYGSGERVYVRDIAAGTTTIASRASGAVGAEADGFAFNHDISEDGRYVVFESDADNLSSEDVDDPDNDGESVRDIFIRDLQANTTELVSRGTGANGDPSEENSITPSISGNGRFVSFSSRGNSLSGDDDNSLSNAFVRDLQTDTTEFVGRDDGANGDGANATNSADDLSDDGRYVLFYSDATNLPGNGAGAGNFFLRDRQAGTTELVSRRENGDPVGSVFGADISGDGTVVYFVSSTNGVTSDDPDGQQDLFIRDLGADSTVLGSRASGGAPANSFTEFVAALSDDGRYVAFASDATNLSTDDEDGATDIFVRDLDEGTTTFVSRASGESGAPGNASSQQPDLSSTARFVVWDSSAANLTEEGNGGQERQQVYRRDLSTGDGGGGGDGMEADLGIRKSDDPDPVEVGERLRYRLVVGNQGPDLAPSVRVVDELPGGVELVHVEPTQGTCSEGEEVVTCNIGGIGVGSEEAVKIVVRPQETGVLHNVARVRSKRDDPDPTDNEVTERTTVESAEVEGTDIRGPSVVGGVGGTGRIPFTGLDVGALLALGLLIASSGVALRVGLALRSRAGGA